ncbi:hypothetical protein HAX54_033903 [Datura stramonium]|uniref:PPM-type phosphatase domain-containing protein n=1 Tax=Datura stramonium TaxID=4076 RepID=A0ABS8VFQ6_DATST|nr:hypothetical protein [Datura stramonium]
MQKLIVGRRKSGGKTSSQATPRVHPPPSVSLRGKSGDSGIIKIKRTSTLDDVASLLLKATNHFALDIRNRCSNSVSGNVLFVKQLQCREVDRTRKRDEDDAENEVCDDDDDVGDEDEYDGEDVDDPEGEDVEVSDAEKKQQRRVSHGFHLVEGKMKHGMEDYLVAENRKMDGHNLGLYAIFDGHSGCKVAEYLQSHIFDNILSEPEFWRKPATAFKKAYRETNDDILENVVGSRGGSTAVTAILIDQKYLVVANVGDSRAVLIRGGKVKQITVDHEPEKEEEKDAVESKGGFVIKMRGGVPRVDGQLSMTRVFGDAKVKDHITVEPNVTIEKIDKDTDSIILASDGLWKVMSNEEVAECIRGIKNGKKAAEELKPTSISCDSDTITAEKYSQLLRRLLLGVKGTWLAAILGI